MKLTDKQIRRLVHLVLQELEGQEAIVYKEKQSQVMERAEQLVRGDYQREMALDAEVQRMMDDLERKNPGEFQRYKMFPLLKKRLAKEKGIVL